MRFTLSSLAACSLAFPAAAQCNPSFVNVGPTADSHNIHGDAILTPSLMPVVGANSELTFTYGNPGPNNAVVYLADTPANIFFPPTNTTIAFDPASVIANFPATSNGGFTLGVTIGNDPGLCGLSPFTWQVLVLDTEFGNARVLGSNRAIWGLGDSADLVITEIMQNPAVVTDANGEWFEIYNNDTAGVDLQGWIIQDQGTDSHVIASSVIVPAGGFVVLGVNADFATNGGVNVDYEYGSGFFLANSIDELEIVSPAGTIVDTVIWDDGVTFPDPTGASMNLSPTAFDRTLNDSGLNWCEAVLPYGAGDLGTPGAANTPCGKGKKG